MSLFWASRYPFLGSIIIEIEFYFICLLSWVLLIFFYFMIELKSIILSRNECCFLSLSDSFLWWPYSLVDGEPIELLNSEIINSYFISLRTFFLFGFIYILTFSMDQFDSVELRSWVLQSYRFVELKMYASCELMLLTILVRILVCSGLTLLSIRY